MKKDNPGSTARAIYMYFRVAFAIALLTAVGAGLLLAENGTRQINGTEPDIAVLSSRDRQVELLFPQSETTLQFRLPQYSMLVDFIPPPLGNVVWFVRAAVEALSQ